jgi:putative peptidoglycan lipid II flippase
VGRSGPGQLPGDRAVAAIGYAQVLYVLPVSLFGMSVAAAELPELSRRRGEATAVLREAHQRALARVAFYVVPSFHRIRGARRRDRRRAVPDGRVRSVRYAARLPHVVRYAIGLLASTASRLFSSTFFALRDTRTPARSAAARVSVSAVLGAVLMVQFEPIAPFGAGGPQVGPGLLGGLDIGGRPLGAVGLALGAGLAAWLEVLLLRRALTPRIGSIALPARHWLRMFGAGFAAAGIGWGIRLLLPVLHPVVTAALVLGAFGLTYFAVAHAVGLSEAAVVFSRLGHGSRR